MTHVFDVSNTRKQQIMVEYITETGSGFAVNPEGEQVFMNKRLIDAMEVEPGNTYEAFLLPNYPDKRDQIPWRAMRVEPIQIDLDLNHVRLDSLINRIVKWMSDSDPGIPFTASEVAEGVEEELETVQPLLEMNQQLFLKTDAYVLLPTDK
tara:strand:+ start:505 stop:957 length:453 start_codon:yes stop_codon:yes gene_type:complete